MEEQTDRGTTDRWIDGWLAEHRDGQEEQVIITVWENDKTTEGTRERERERESKRERQRGEGSAGRMEEEGSLLALASSVSYDIRGAMLAKQKLNRAVESIMNRELAFSHLNGCYLPV